MSVIARKGICLNPYESLIRNIGMDGSGEHNVVTDLYDTKLMDQGKELFDLPDEIEVLDDTRRAYVPLFGSYTAMNRDDDEKKKILVYGIGNYYLQNEQEICEKYYVQAFIDKKKHEWFAGKRIIKKSMIKNYTYDFILVMIRDSRECMKVAEELKKMNIEAGKIIMGHDFLKRR